MIFLGIIKALCCFACATGAVLIFNSAGRLSKAHEIKDYQAILMVFTALACLGSGCFIGEDVFRGSWSPERIAFFVTLIPCAITFIGIITSIDKA